MCFLNEESEGWGTRLPVHSRYTHTHAKAPEAEDCIRRRMCVDVSAGWLVRV